MKINELVDNLFEIEGNDHEVDSKWLSKLVEFYDNGGDINELSNRNNWQLIHIAALNGLDKATEWLVKNGANINSRDEQGCTPLLFAFDLDIDGAIQNGETIDFSHSKKLIFLGADVTAEDNEGKNLENIASAYGKKMKLIFETHFR